MPVAAVRWSVLQWGFINEIAARIDRAELSEAKEEADAVGAHSAVFRAMGLDRNWEREFIARRSR